MPFKKSKFFRQKAALGGEYGLLVGLIAIIILTSLSLSGQRITDLFNVTGNMLNNVIAKPSLGTEEDAPVEGFQYVIVDLAHDTNFYGLFTELSFQDGAGGTLTYTPIDSYSPDADGQWPTWNHASWGKANMNDGDLTSAQEDSLLYSMTNENGYSPLGWGRFSVDFGSPKDIKEIEMVVARQGYYTDGASFYGTNEVDYETHLRGRQNTGLTTLGSMTFSYPSMFAVVTETVTVP